MTAADCGRRSTATPVMRRSVVMPASGVLILPVTAEPREGCQGINISRWYYVH